MPMRPRAAFADLRSLASGATTRRGLVIAAIALVERMLTPVIALTSRPARAGRQGGRHAALRRGLHGSQLPPARAGRAQRRASCSSGRPRASSRATSSGRRVLPDHDVFIQAAQGVNIASLVLTQTFRPSAPTWWRAVCSPGWRRGWSRPTLVALAAALMVTAAAVLLVSRRAVALHGRPGSGPCRSASTTPSLRCSRAGSRSSRRATGRRPWIACERRRARGSAAGGAGRRRQHPERMARLTLVAIAGVVAGALLAELPGCPARSRRPRPTSPFSRASLRRSSASPRARTLWPATRDGWSSWPASCVTGPRRPPTGRGLSLAPVADRPSTRCRFAPAMADAPAIR